MKLAIKFHVLPTKLSNCDALPVRPDPLKKRRSIYFVTHAIRAAL